MLVKKNAVLQMPADAAAAGGGALEYAGFWARFAALAVDSAILAIVGVLLLVALSMALGGTGAEIANVALVLIYLFYWPVMEASARQATFGKQLLGIQVTDVDGNRISFVKSLLRNLAKIISAIPFYIGFLLAAFTGRKQALHDMITSCLVVRAGPSSFLKAVGAAVVGLVIAGAAGYYYVTEVLFGEFKREMTKGMEQAMKGTQKDMQRETDKAMKQAEMEMKKEMEKAMQQAQKGAPPTPPAPVASPAAPTPAPKTAVAASSALSSPTPPKPAGVIASAAAAQPATPAPKEAAPPRPAPETAPAAADKPKAKRRVTKRKPAPSPPADVAALPPARTPKYNDVMTAVVNRDRAGTAEALEVGFWADRADSNGVTPLMAAAMNGDAAIAQLLLKHGADPNRSGPGGSVLDYAKMSRDAKVIEVLKKAGAR